MGPHVCFSSDWPAPIRAASSGRYYSKLNSCTGTSRAQGCVNIVGAVSLVEGVAPGPYCRAVV